MEMRKQRIGIMGGTFDPIHMGHLILGEKAYEQLNLDKVWFMPSGNPPHKQERQGRATDEQRTEMVRRAIEGNPHFELSLFEMQREGYSYTYLTLESLQQQHPEMEFFFIIGADSLFDFHKWMKPEHICAACTLVVAVRNQTSMSELEEKMLEMEQQYHGTFMRLDTPDLDISSKQLRNWIQEKKSIRYYVSDAVEQYIKDNGIYCLTGEEEA